MVAVQISAHRLRQREETAPTTLVMEICEHENGGATGLVEVSRQGWQLGKTGHGLEAMELGSVISCRGGTGGEAARAGLVRCRRMSWAREEVATSSIGYGSELLGWCGGVDSSDETESSESVMG